MTKDQDGRPLSDEEVELWLRVMQGAAPLHEESRRVEPAPPPAVPETAPALKASASTVSPPPLLEPLVSVPAQAVPKFAGIDRRSAERLRRGEKTIEAKLDLHGMTRQEAHGALLNFLFRSHEAERRCVLVVTGKGNRGAGVLRSEVPRWIQSGPVRDIVLATTPAQPKHGGDGALYVLLKRRRS